VPVPTCVTLDLLAEDFNLVDDELFPFFRAYFFLLSCRLRPPFAGGMHEGSAFLSPRFLVLC